MSKAIQLPLKYREWVQKGLETLERAGVIVRSISPWASPIIVVPKKTEPGEPPRRRLCVDYRVINSLLPEVQKAHSKAKGVLTLVPLPQIDHICRATTRPPRPSSTAECLRLIACLRGEQASAASWEPRPPFEATEMD